MEGPLNIERDVVKNGVRLDCVFEGYEYRPEREEVRSQRLAGFGCVEIAENTGLSLEQVTDYCRELGLPETGSCQLQPPDGSGERCCPVCGRILVQRGNSGRRRFCSPACREEYYRQHKVSAIQFTEKVKRRIFALGKATLGIYLIHVKISVKVLKTNDTWYGMTYHEDVAAVKDSFKKMLEKGVYKADLFADL